MILKGTEFTDWYIFNPSPPVNEIQGGMSILLFVQILVWPITFYSFEISLPYFEHKCITMRRCVAYTYYLDSMLTFDLKVNFIGFLTNFCSGHIFSSFEKVIPYLVHKRNTMGKYVKYIPDLCITLTFDLYVNGVASLVSFYHSFYFLNFSLIMTLTKQVIENKLTSLMY